VRPNIVTHVEKPAIQQLKQLKDNIIIKNPSFVNVIVRFVLKKRMEIFCVFLVKILACFAIKKSIGLSSRHSTANISSASTAFLKISENKKARM